MSNFDSSDEEDTPSNLPTSGPLHQGSTSNAPQTGNMAGVTSNKHTKQQGAHACIMYTFYFVFLHIDHPTMYHLVGDNVDKGIKQRYMRVGTSKPDDIHYFHSYAVGDRIDFMNLSDQVIPTLQQNSEQVAVSLLPTSDDDLALRNNMCILMSRILYENMGFFNLAFDSVVDWHIKHQFYDEMSTKSKVVSKTFYCA